MALTAQDAAAIAEGAQRLGVDPRTLGALFELESGVDPNIWGGAGKQYRGLIQFGPGARKEVGLPDRPMTVAEQMPYVLKYFEQRGFQPGRHGPTELYRTVLVGNPRQSGTDSFGTNSDQAARRMVPGGDLYQRFSQKFDPALAQAGSQTGGQAAFLPPAARRGGASGSGADPLGALLALPEPALPVFRGLGVVEPGRNPLAAAALAQVAAATGGPLTASARLAGSPAFLTPLLAQAEAMGALAGRRPAPPAAPLAPPPVPRAEALPEVPWGGGLTPAPGGAPGGFVARTGNSGTSTGPHLDARWADGRPIRVEDLNRYLSIGGKDPSAFPLTSGYGPRRAPTAGASSFHKGVDLGIPVGTAIYARGGARLRQSLGEQGGAGYMVEVETPEGPLHLLHLTPGSSPLSRRR